MARIRWLGHATFIIKLSGYTIAIDPWITNPLSPYRSIDSFAKDYPDIDFIFVTHDHGDHVGDSIELLKRYRGAKLVALYELAEHIAREVSDHNRVVATNIGGPVKLGGIEAVFTPAVHSSSISDPSGVIVFGEDKAIYHAGDTGIFSEMSLIKELYNPTVVLIPIGGHFTMGIKEAVKALELLRPRYAIPMHYNTFDVIRVDVDKFVELAKNRVPETTIVVLKPGEELVV
ncbi:beta-lactamase domain protein [Ignisphaera aggregans DSM 17230]|uniref:UPF0173 metal-dependent hydrolase Igag_0335 n=1 Tax=Ignisphaera aggregans (strain DSM 17230 / JCM 13409 / AQ1.S1) TaxID=583356 RepID=E0SR32_IGNAA|nr:beta-lactamase domain protein [Ignisphaera aggregans DSM 17230]